MTPKATPEATAAARRYLCDYLGGRSGFSDLLSNIEREDPETWAEILDELGLSFEEYAREGFRA